MCSLGQPQFLQLLQFMHAKLQGCGLPELLSDVFFLPYALESSVLWNRGNVAEPFLPSSSGRSQRLVPALLCPSRLGSVWG